MFNTRLEDPGFWSLKRRQIQQIAQLPPKFWFLPKKYSSLGNILLLLLIFKRSILLKGEEKMFSFHFLKSPSSAFLQRNTPIVAANWKKKLKTFLRLRWRTPTPAPDQCVRHCSFLQGHSVMKTTNVLRKETRDFRRVPFNPRTWHNALLQKHVLWRRSWDSIFAKWRFSCQDASSQETAKTSVLNWWKTRTPWVQTTNGCNLLWMWIYFKARTIRTKHF